MKMKKRWKSINSFTALALILGLAMVGCSGSSSVSPTGSNSNNQLGQSGFGSGSGASLLDEVQGVVESVDVANRIISVVGDATVFNISDSAEIKRKVGMNNVVITLGEITAGEDIRLRGTIQTDGSFLASNVRLNDNNNNNNNPQDSLRGRVESIDFTARTMTLVGDPTMITVMDGAEVEAKNHGSGILITLEGIIVGDSVSNRGDLNADGSFAANRVRLIREDVESQRIFGTIETVDATTRSITIVGNSTVVDVAAGARIESDTTDDTGFGILDAGDLVELRGRLNADGTFRAFRIKVDNRSSDKS